MTYLTELQAELSAAGIPARRRARILAEFSEHLREDPAADLGAPRDLARQFAEELGTRLARGTAYRAFGALTLAAVLLIIMFFDGGRTWGGWVGYGRYPVSGYFPAWWVPMMVVCFLAAQVALASGSLALLRAWRLRRVAAITAADAAVLNRRAAVGLVSGAITMSVLPLTDVVVDAGARWSAIAVTAGPAVILLLLALLPDVLRAARLRPTRHGPAGDLTADLGINDPRITPWRIAMTLSLAILVAMTALGAHSDDTYDGILRGLFDGTACVTGFGLLGRYLGLRPDAHDRVGSAA